MEQGLPSLPNGWHKKQLGDVVKLSQGTQVPVGDQYLEQEDGLIRFLRISDFVRSDEPPRYILNPGSQYLVEADDICMIRYGDAGRAVTGLAGALANNLFKISPIESLLKRFLFLQLCSPRCVDYLRAANNSSTMPAISFKAVNAMKVSVAPLDEQKRIVEKLDALLTRIDTAIEHLQESVTLADALFESSQSEIFNDVLSNYQHSTIDEICIVTSSKRIFKADYVESGIPFYRTKEIVDLSKEKNISTELFIDKEKFSEICGKFGAPKKGDLLFSAVGTIGVMWIVDEREFYFKDGNLLWLKDMNGVTPEYLKSAISAVLTEKIKDRSQGAAYKAISITSLKAFEIPLPSIEEQKSIVAKIEHVSSVTKKTKQELSLQINDLHNLKASILDSAFKGEL